MKKVVVNGYVIDDAIVDFVSDDDIRIKLISHSKLLDGDFLYNLCSHEVARKHVNVSIYEDFRVVHAAVRVVSLLPEFDEKVTVTANCQCLPIHDRHGNEDGVQLSIEYL